MKEKFGENFNPDLASRVTILEKDKKVPDYVDFSREVRRILKGSAEQDKETPSINWPEYPSGLTSLEDFFNAAKDAVTTEWDKATAGLLSEKYQEWLKVIPDTEENKEIIELLKNPQKLNDELKVQTIDKLEGLREYLPEAWRTLILVSSERQLAVLTVLRHWLKNDMSSEDFEALGMNKEELEILLDAGGILGKYIDHAYVKQIELADEPGGTAKTKLGAISGAEFIYDIYTSSDGKGIVNKTFSEVFAGEWPKIINGLNLLSKKVELLLKEKKLPESYQPLPSYLNNLATAYGSSETSPKKLLEMWEEIDIEIRDLVKNGCPLMIIPGGCPGVTGEANKMDVELRLGVRDKGLMVLEKVTDDFRDLAQEVLDQHQDQLSKHYEIPKMIFNIQPLAFGSNLQYFTYAETGGGRMISHINAIKENFYKDSLPNIEKMFPEKFLIKSLVTEEAFILDAVMHEFCHNIISTEDPAVLKRLGNSLTAQALDELKAESASMILVNDYLEKISASERQEVAEKQFFAKLASVLHFLVAESSGTNTYGEKYFLTGAVIVKRLFEAGILIENNGQYQVTDPSEGIKVIASLGQEILERFYYNTDATAKDVKGYIKELRLDKRDPKIEELIKRIKE